MNKAELKERVLDLLTSGDNNNSRKLEYSVDERKALKKPELHGAFVTLKIHTLEYLEPINRNFLYKKEFDPRTNGYTSIE